MLHEEPTTITTTAGAAHPGPRPAPDPERALPVRGALSRRIAELLVGSGPTAGFEVAEATSRVDALSALWVLQELHYRGFAGVDETWEWHPDLLALRVRLEADLETRLRERWDRVRGSDGIPAPALGRPDRPDRIAVAAALAALVADDAGPSLARHLHHRGTAEEALDLLRQRSVYHLKEADPTAWVVPRLSGRVKTALTEIQYDEYGAGRPGRLHHELFRRGLVACGLDDAHAAYVGEALEEVLEHNTALTMFGLHRRLRGAALGHFAAFEASSSLPSRQMAQGLRRMGLADEMAAYYDEHVEADAVHEQTAARDVCGALVEDEPGLLDDVLFGAWTCLDLESRTAAAMLQRWGASA